MKFTNTGEALLFFRQGEQVRIEPWGKDSLRVRATMLTKFTGNDWALTENTVNLPPEITIEERQAAITNGKITAVVNHQGVMTFFKDGKRILQEYFRNYDGTLVKESCCLKVVNRDWKGITGGSEHELTVKFESNPGEKIFGMGQYQQQCMDLKGCILELAQRNSQISVPFAVSSLGYGFLWNNPAVGKVVFGKNYTEWTARATKEMDYWITAASTPKQILENYTTVTGRAQMFPEDRMGLWQCKLRYRTGLSREIGSLIRLIGLTPRQWLMNSTRWASKSLSPFGQRLTGGPKTSGR